MGTFRYFCEKILKKLKKSTRSFPSGAVIYAVYGQSGSLFEIYSENPPIVPAPFVILFAAKDMDKHALPSKKTVTFFQSSQCGKWFRDRTPRRYLFFVRYSGCKKYRDIGSANSGINILYENIVVAGFGCRYFSYVNALFSKINS